MKEKRHILILGAGVMQIPAIRIAVEMGLYVTVADGNQKAPGISLADRFLHVDLKDKEQLAAEAEKLSPPVDGVFTAGTDFSLSVSWIANALGLPGIPLETAERATDKALMRQCFRDKGVPSPKFVYAESEAMESSLESLLEGLEYPLVVKPVDNMGSRGIRRVDSLAECTHAVNDAFSLSRKGKVIIEEFIEGDEYSVDALVWDDRIYICGIADRHIHFPPYFIEMGHTMPSCADEETIRGITEVFKEGIKALGITRGAAKGDIKYNSKGAFVGEIAARLSGGYMSGWTYPYASGINPSQGGINIALGNPPFDHFEPQPLFSAERAYISIPGKIRRIYGHTRGLATLYVKDHFSRIAPGDRVMFPRNNVEKCGNFISQAPDRRSAVESAESACREMVIELIPDDDKTFSYLTGRGVPHYMFPHDAGITEHCRRMPLFAGEPDLNPEMILNVLPNDAVLNWDILSWHGDSVDNQIRKCRQHGIAVPGRESSKLFSAGGPFWLAFIRGGFQGALWFRDTLYMHIEKGDWKDWLQCWYERE